MSNTYNDYYNLERTKAKKAKAQKRLDYYNKTVKSYFWDQSVTQSDLESRRQAAKGWGIVTTDY
jgi:hypothetical protein